MTEERILDKPPRILPCTCEHEYQDTVYGKGMRVHNFGVTDKIWRCTVCGNEKKVSY